MQNTRVRGGGGGDSREEKINRNMQGGKEKYFSVLWTQSGGSVRSKYTIYTPRTLFNKNCYSTVGV